MHIIVAFLAPMFLVSAGGDAAVARAAAAQTVESYTARNPLHLLAIAQMIALGFGVLSSMTLSMTDSLSIPTILRLRGNAASLNRAAEQCRRALAGKAAQDCLASEFDPQAEQMHEEAMIADLARAEQRLAEIQQRNRVPPEPASLEQHQPDWNSRADKVARENNGLDRADCCSQPESGLVAAAAPSQPVDPPQVAVTSKPGDLAQAAAPARTAPARAVTNQAALAPLAPPPPAAGPAREIPAAAGSLAGAVPVTVGRPPVPPSPGPLPAQPDPAAEDAHRRNAWAAGMARVARELTSNLTSLPPAERRAAGIRAAALSSVAQELLSNDPMPPSLFKLPRP